MVCKLLSTFYLNAVVGENNGYIFFFKERERKKLKDMEDRVRRSNIHLIRVPKGKEERVGERQYLRNERLEIFQD